MIEAPRSLKIHGDFQSTLERLNAQKKEDASVALILWGSRDFNGFLSSASTHSQLLQIAKTHKLAISGINDARQVGSQIDRAQSLAGKEISLLVIVAHGEANKIHFGKSSIFNLFSGRRPSYQEKDINPNDFSSLALDAKIALYSCNTGKELAQKIADIANRTVLAPTRDLYDAATCFSSSKENGIKMLSYNEKGEQHVCAFRPKLSPELLLPKEIDSTVNQTAFATMANYLKKRASEGDMDAQCKLGFFYEKGLGGLEQSDIEAKKWFCLAAMRGSGLAQLNLGCFYMNGRGGERSDIEAEKWFRLSAYQGIALAQFYLGIFYLNGDGGLTQSDKKAASLFTLSALQSLPEGIYNLGVLYEFGRGVRQSNKEAARLYKMAYELGIQDAVKRLSIISEQKEPSNKTIRPSIGSLIRDYCSYGASLRDVALRVFSAVKERLPIGAEFFKDKASPIQQTSLR